MKGVLLLTTMNTYVAADTILRDILPGNEPAKLIAEIVLNTESGLEAVPVEMQQGNMEGMIMQEED